MDIRTAYASLTWYKQIRSEVREILAKLEIADGGHFTALLDEVPDDVWNEIASRYDIKISFRAMSPKLHALCPFFEEAVAKGRGYWIWINSSLLDIEDEKLKWAMIRSAGFHELAHILSNGPFRVDDSMSSAARTALNGYARDPSINNLLEARTELLAAEIAFSPEKKFLGAFYKTGGNFRELMEQFQMPVDCCVKWALITDAQTPAHYVKYNVPSKKVEDLHLPKEHPYNSFAFPLDATLFQKDPATIATECLQLRKDHEGPSKGADGLQRFYCKAYFLKSDTALGNAEKIVVIGFPQDGFDRIQTMKNIMTQAQTATPPPIQP